MEEAPLRIVYFRIQALYPPMVPRFSGSALQELYLKISEHHQFEKFESIGDQGAKLSTEAIRDCQILRDRIMLSENVIQRSFEIVTKDFADILGIVKEKFNIPVLVDFRCVLRALWPLPTEMDASSFLRSQALNINDDQFRLLGVPVAGTGLRVNCPDLEHNKIHDFKIEPFFRDTKNLFIELASSFPEPIQTVPICDQRMQECYEFLMNKIVSFVKSFGFEGIS